MPAPDDRAAGARPVAPFLFALLLAASLAAAALAIDARGPDLALEVTRFPKQFEPDARGPGHKARIRFFVRESDPAATVEIVGRDLEPVHILDASVALAAGEVVAYRWNGRTDDGRPAPQGSYRLRVVLPSRDRDMVFPRRIELRR